MPAYLKKVYDGEMIERNVKTQQIRVDEPALTVFGRTVVATLKDNLKRSMLVDGLAQRFAWFIAERGNRSLLAEYRGFKKASKRIVEQWASLSKTAILHCYRTSPTSSAAFQEMMDAVTARCRALSLGDGCIKRISHRGLKYALIYHVVMGKAGDVLDAETSDMRRGCAPSTYETSAACWTCIQARRWSRRCAKRRWTCKPSGWSASWCFLRAQRDASMPPRTVGHLRAKVRQLSGLKAPQIRALMVQACERDPSLSPFAILEAGLPFVKRPSAQPAGRKNSTMAKPAPAKARASKKSPTPTALAKPASAKAPKAASK